MVQRIKGRDSVFVDSFRKAVEQADPQGCSGPCTAFWPQAFDAKAISPQLHVLA